MRRLGNRSHTPPMMSRPTVMIMSAALPMAWPKPDPPYSALTVLFTTVMSGSSTTSPNFRHTPGVSMCTPGWKATGTPSSWHADQNGS